MIGDIYLNTSLIFAARPVPFDRKAVSTFKPHLNTENFVLHMYMYSSIILFYVYSFIE